MLGGRSSRGAGRLAVLAAIGTGAWAVGAPSPLEASSFSVSGYSFERFEKHNDSCYQCGGGGGTRRALEPWEVERSNLLVEANYAWSRHDHRTAVELALKALALRDDPELRAWIRREQALMLVDEGNALLQKRDLRGALDSFRRATSLWADAILPEGRPEVEALARAIAQQEAADAARRAEAAKRQNLIAAWESANAQAREHLQHERWAEAAAAFNQASRQMPQDTQEFYAIYNALPAEVSANRDIAAAGIARSHGDLDTAIQNLQGALSWDASNALASRLLREALDEREKSRAPMRAAFARAETMLDSNAVDARGPKPLAEVIASVPELASSPAAERARKGLMAAANHDWKAALAWYQDALNHDPGNPVLKRAVDLAQWMVKSRPASGPIPQSSAASLDGTGAELARKLAQAYTDMADQIVKRHYDNDYERAKADYFAHQFRMEAVEATMFSRAANQPQQSQALPFKQ